MVLIVSSMLTIEISGFRFYHLVNILQLVQLNTSLLFFTIAFCPRLLRFFPHFPSGFSRNSLLLDTKTQTLLALKLQVCGCRSRWNNELFGTLVLINSAASVLNMISCSCIVLKCYYYKHFTFVNHFY